MKFKFSLLISVLIILLFNLAKAQPPLVNQRCIGSNYMDNFYDVILADSNFFWVTMGTGVSVAEFSDKPFLHPAVLIKMDTNLNIISKKYFGGSNGDNSFSSLVLCKDGGVLCLGFTSATNGDCIGATSTSSILLIRTDSLGNKIWSKTYPITCFPSSNPKITLTTDGSALFQINTTCPGGIISTHYGSGMTCDATLIKVDSIGDLKWVKTFGGSENDWIAGQPVQFDSLHYFIDVFGWSSDYDFAGTFGTSDTIKQWLVLLDTSGNIIKQKFERRYNDFENCRQVGMYNNRIYMTCTGLSTSKLVNNSPEHQGDEGAIVIYDSSFNFIKMKQWGGKGLDYFLSSCRDEFGNFYFTGNTFSSNSGDIKHTLKGNADFWIVKTDSNLQTIWIRTFGGVLHNADAGTMPLEIMVVGNKLFFWGYCGQDTSYSGGDVLCGHLSNVPGYMTADAWVAVFDLRLDKLLDISSINLINHDCPFSVFPNPASSLITLKSNFKPVSHDKNFKIVISNLKGDVLLNEFFNPELDYSINTEHYIDGAYFLQIQCDAKTTFSCKFLIQN